MIRERLFRSDRFVVAILLLTLLGLASCGSKGPGPSPVSTATPSPVSAAMPSPSSEAAAAPAPPADQQILALPPAFRYEVTLRHAGSKDEPATVITGQYRDGTWSQSARRGEDAPEELDRRAGRRREPVT